MKKILLLLLILLAVGVDAVRAQERRITGRVLDETGQGLPGAGITVKGTTVGTVTDIDGNFQLNVPDGSNTLVIQAIGYGTQEVSANANTVVRMQTAAKELQGAVVTALGIRREKRDIGYAATTLNNDELNSGNNVSALSAIQGKTAGVNITSTTGGPSGSTRVVLRGEKSIGRNNNALIVIDGVPLNNGGRLRGDDERSEIDFGNRGNDINPDDIESITVLKGPAAAALYGSDGALGAIMITTKKGRARTGPSKSEVTFQSTFTLSNVLKYPEFQHKYGQGNIYQGIDDDRRENFSWGYEMDGKLRPWGQVINGQQLVKPYSDQPDNVKSAFNTATTWDNYLSIGGGTEKSAFFLSLNALNNKGVVPNTFYNRYGIRFNGSTSLTNKLYASINVNYNSIYSRVEQQGQGDGSFWQTVIQTPRDIPLWEAKNYGNPFYGYGFVDESGVSRYGYFNAYSENPFWVAENFDNRNRTDRILGNTVVGYKFNEDIEIFNRTGVDMSADRTALKTPKYSFLPYDDFYSPDNTGRPVLSKGGYKETNINQTSVFNDVILMVNRQLSERVGFGATLGNSIRYERTNALLSEINPTTNGLVIPGYYNFNNAEGPIISDNQITDFRTVSAYGSLRLSYLNQVFLEMTGRNDWVSSLKSNPSFFYPSVNASWVFSELFKNSNFGRDVLTYGKFRVGYASVGTGAGAYQDNPPRYVRADIGTGFGTVIPPFNGQPAYTFQNILVDPSLRNERTNAWEAGVELSFLKDRISTEVSVYKSVSIDQIVTVPIPAPTGFNGKVMNLGDIENRGLEMSLRVTPIKTRSGFRWDLFGTYFKNTNEVTRLPQGTTQVVIGGVSSMVLTANVGQPFGSFYGIDIQKDEQGRAIIDTNTGTPLLTPNRVYLGSIQPKFIASWGTTLKYKGFTFNMLFDTKQGGKFVSYTKDLLGFVGVSEETENRDDRIWDNSVYVDAGGNLVPNTRFEYSPYDWFANGKIPDGQHVVDASYVKLREASLYYTLPESIYKRSPFGSITLGVFGNNLLLWTAESNKYVDPESGSGGATNLQGFEFRSRQSLRNYGFSLKVTF